MSGDSAVARAIADLDESPAVKKCLQQLFMHELNNAEKKMPTYTDKYESVIAECAEEWEAPDAEVGEQE